MKYGHEDSKYEVRGNREITRDEESGFKACWEIGGQGNCLKMKQAQGRQQTRAER
jgi:hypothetical protein